MIIIITIVISIQGPAALADNVFHLSTFATTNARSESKATNATGESHARVENVEAFWVEALLMQLLRIEIGAVAA